MMCCRRGREAKGPILRNLFGRLDDHGYTNVLAESRAQRTMYVSGFGPDVVCTTDMYRRVHVQ